MKKGFTLKMLALLICTASFTTMFAQIASTDFVTTWKTDNAGSSNSTSIIIPTYGTTGYNYEVDWNNDGIFEDVGVTGSITHDYGVVCTPTIRIRGIFPRIDISYNKKITAINQWGNMVWSSMRRAFYGCENLTIPATDSPNLSAVTDMSYMFTGCTSFNEDLNNWDVSNVTNMQQMFYYCIAFNQDIGSWDVSNVTNMKQMFTACQAFNQDIGSWDVSSVTNMSSLFESCFNFNQDLSNWDVSSVTNMQQMLYYCYAFNQNIGSWDVSSVANMQMMFWRCSVFNQDISSWDVSNVTNMFYMFTVCSVFNQDISSWDVSSVTNMKGMFVRCYAFNQDIGSWDVSSVIDMNSMFWRCSTFNQDIGSWDISSVTDMGNMLDDSDLSIANYDATLMGWAAQNVQTGLSLGAVGLKYCAAQAARDHLINNMGWTILDAGTDGPGITTIDTKVACDFYTWIDGITYTASNNTATYGLGCNIITLNLTINNSTASTDVQFSCDAYTWIDGNTYTQNNTTATYILTNVAGCDSVVTLSLTIYNSPVVDAGLDGSVLFSSTTGVDPAPCITLVGSVSNANSFEWIDDQGAVVSNSLSLTVCPIVTTTYTLTAIGDNCTTSDDVIVTAVDLGGDAPLADPVGNNANKTYVCHDGVTIEVNANGNCNAQASLCYHLNHGDVMGGCSSARMAFNEESSSSAIISENDFNVFPNPFSGSTTLSFTLSKTNAVTIEVYNVLGTKVTTIYNGVAEAGQNYTVTLDRSTLLSSGIYYCRLSTAGEVKNKKIILVD